MHSFIYLIFIVLIFSGCRSSDLIPYNSKQNIKILNVDFDKFEYQTVFKFVTKKTRKFGFLFIDKKEEKVIEFLKLKKGKHLDIIICQIYKIRGDNDIYIKSGRSPVGVNDDNPNNRYYDICHQQLNKIKNGL